MYAEKRFDVEVPAKPTTVTDVLSMAADLIECRGWAQSGNVYAAEGPVCPITAVSAIAKYNSKLWNDAYWRLENYIGEGVAEWNEGRTQAEVVRVMRAAAG